MYQLTTLLIMLSANFLMALAAPLPDAQSLDKRITHVGIGTWFNVGEGACGDWNVNTDPIVAISAQIYGSGGNCGQWVQVTNTEVYRSPAILFPPIPGLSLGARRYPRLCALTTDRIEESSKHLVRMCFGSAKRITTFWRCIINDIFVTSFTFPGYGWLRKPFDCR
ncbi:hypothetical protein PAXINDRAFT_130423 [Paxillus involutus ATCC 200175]|nr:hypothetical protein PAXINDRAFT_130423 [Paxillus involutus ATCC 200175]